MNQTKMWYKYNLALTHSDVFGFFDGESDEIVPEIRVVVFLAELDGFVHFLLLVYYHSQRLASISPSAQQKHRLKQNVIRRQIRLQQHLFARKTTVLGKK